ncbi:hypothetical protein LAV73_23635 [Lysinibacillus xylanilyticus]|uniref:hypothetical protein n=1 Tax=Lysinibacillus xylanilyticus TaxID=582475 RepID=UPI002B253AD6|nr:hypothetical protein [Lysinibacillus xylanilyticus]MEB2282914.1 hypothetical protein [Lysinibacillus xylanilyticus]
MSELTKDNKVSELIASKRALKELRKILNTRDTTIREVFNSLGYFYNKSQHEWQRDADFPDRDMTFNEALAQLKAAAAKQTPKANKKLIKVNKDLIETNKEVAVTTPNNELIETNSQQNIEVLNAIGLSETEFHVLKKMIQERIQQEDPHDQLPIFNEISKLNTRSRKNKTYYISEELVAEVDCVADKLNIKKSQLVEVALLEFFKRHGSIQ